MRHIDLIVIHCSVTHPQYFIDNRTRIMRKKLSYVKYSSEGSGFLGFYAYLYDVRDDFA